MSNRSIDNRINPRRLANAFAL